MERGPQCIRGYNKIKIKAAMSAKSVSKSPKKRDFARLYWSDEDSLFIRLDFFRIV